MTEQNEEWFESWFGEEYVALYPHRDTAEAKKAVDLIARSLDGHTINRALDLACGPGRHARFLAERWWTSGVDLSEILLRSARQNGIQAKFVRADIRELPYRDSTFDLVVNLFTSFGYFESDDEHERVIRDLARVIAPGGSFVLDFLNEKLVKRTLVPLDESVRNGKKVRQTREITPDGRFVVKHIHIEPNGRDFIERVRLFTRAELTGMLERRGFHIQHSFGDYEGAPLDDDSLRVILVARRK
ncbi:MAG TPA: class I SAM-dependent methyltransferase [Gemmatimonadaceae bacterium]|nr:class I SAM-dependent methyltransferase [Gemmatimonadaceae bacterium]